MIGCVSLVSGVEWSLEESRSPGDALPVSPSPSWRPCLLSAAFLVLVPLSFYGIAQLFMAFYGFFLWHWTTAAISVPQSHPTKGSDRTVASALITSVEIHWRKGIIFLIQFLIELYSQYIIKIIWSFDTYCRFQQWHCRFSCFLLCKLEEISPLPVQSYLYFPSSLSF